MTILKIATWNVNSIRVRLNILINFLKDNQIDIILLQETKCMDMVFPYSDIVAAGYNYLVKGQKSYNGVAILSKYPLELEYDILPENDEDFEARYIECTCVVNQKLIRVSTIYVPNGNSVDGEECERRKDIMGIESTARYQYKMSFFERIKNRLNKLKSINDEIIVFGGD